MKKQATVKKNRIVVRTITNNPLGKYEVVFTDTFQTYDKMYADSVSEVAMIAHEMADNNDIGRALAEKIVNALNK